MNEFIPTHIRLTKEQYDRLRREAFEKKMSQAEIVRLALEKYWREEKMKEYEWIKQWSDAELYEVGGRYVKVIWGFSTGSETGVHNELDTDVGVYVWIGEDEISSAEDLPTDLFEDDWETVDGFDLIVDEDGEVDWEEYAKKVDEILAQIEEA